MTIYNLEKARVLGHTLDPEPHAQMQVEADTISDGHHTMSELYKHRHALFIALCKIYDNYITPLGSRVLCWKSKKHDDGSSYEGWFLLGMSVTVHHFTKADEQFDISYHLPMEYWDRIKVLELETAPLYNGYTSDDVLERLFRL